MTIKIGEKIKQLRKKNDVTQDRLAEYLGVTAQAVSRWESESCYPDLEILPSLASFFNITIDELLCYDKSEQEQASISAKVASLLIAGKHEESTAEARRGLALYPQNHQLALQLASLLNPFSSGTAASPNEGEYNHDYDEPIALCQRILRDCKGGSDENDVIRLSAKGILITMLCSVNRREEALTLTLGLPSFAMAQEFMAQYAFKGTARLMYSLLYLPALTTVTAAFVNHMFYADDDKSAAVYEYSFEECQRDITIWDAIYAQQDKKDGQTSKLSAWTYMCLHQRAARTLLEAGNSKRSAEYFKRAVECMPYIDGNQAVFTVNLVQRNLAIGCDLHCLKDAKAYAEKSSAYVLLHGYVENGYYNGLESEPVYIETLELLKSYANNSYPPVVNFLGIETL